MNFAFSSILIFFLLLPGLIFFRFYYSGVFSKQFFKATAFEIFYMSLAPGIVVHFLGFLWVENFSPFLRVDLVVLGQVFSDPTDEDLITNSFESIHGNIQEIFLYNSMLCIMSAILGFTSKFIVRVTDLDQKYKLFRFQNHWHYWLNSEIYHFENIGQLRAKDPDEYYLETVYVDILLEVNNKETLYRGVIADYLLSSSNGLDLIYLKEASKRDVELRGEPFIPIPGDYFIIKYDEIKNLNITYVRSKKKKPKLNWLVKFIAVMLTLSFLLGLPLIACYQITIGHYMFGGIVALLYLFAWITLNNK